MLVPTFIRGHVIKHAHVIALGVQLVTAFITESGKIITIVLPKFLELNQPSKMLTDL